MHHYKFGITHTPIQHKTQNHSLYSTLLLLYLHSYPEGNFRGNQLLDSSISLSPLYTSQTNDLHVSIATGFHHSFKWLHPAQA